MTKKKAAVRCIQLPAEDRYPLSFPESIGLGRQRLKERKMMFRLVMGASGHGKTSYIRKLLCDTVKKTGEEAVLIVPDQFTFATEKAILEEAGPRFGAQIKVWSFRRLCEEVFLRYGGIHEKRLSDTAKTVFMSLAIKSCREQLKVYKASSDKITQMMLDAVDEFKGCLITPDQVSETGRQCRGGLRDKAHDIGLIYSVYEALLANTYIDSQDLIPRAVEVLRTKPDFFSGKTVALDGFESFNKQKLAMISLMMRQAENCLVTLCGDSLHVGNGSVLDPVNKTASALHGLAVREHVPVGTTVFLKDGVRFESPELAYLEESLFSPAAVPWVNPAEHIRIFEGRTVYEEAEFAAATIRDLVMQKGYRYGDFALICRDASKYFPVIGSTFEKWDVPCYFSEPKRLDGEPLIRMLLSAYRTIRYGFRTDDLLTMLKTGICPINSEELSNLENYVFLWKLSGNAWKNEFTQHPKGFGYEQDESSEEMLNSLNEIRKRMVFPLLHLAEKTRESTGRGISQAIYEFLIELNVDRRMVENAAAYEAAGHPELVGEGPALWQKLMDILDEFVTVFGEETISRDDYFNYLEAVLSREETRDIPIRMDTVTFGTADLLKSDGIKAVFVLGAVQGELPKIPTSSGVFSDHERKDLISLNLPLEEQQEDQTKLERFIAYTAVTAASRDLFLSYHISHNGEDLEPSELVDSIKMLFPQVEVCKELPEEMRVSSYASAFSALAATYRKKDRLSSTLLKLFEGKEEYEGRLNSLRRVVSEEPHRIRSGEIAGKMFGGNYISASQIDTYHRCPFQYFCRYGLNAKERKPAEINVLEYGTLMHYLFESVLSGDFTKYIGQETLLRADVEKLIRSYVNEKMGGYETMSGRDKYRFRRMCDAAVTILVRLMEELSVSEFKPAFFELPLSEESGFPPLKIQTEAGTVVKVGGVIDRVDLYSTGGEIYVRIVDYKTGRKDFKLLDVLYGLNLQMLVYLAAMAQKGTLLPAGIMYMPSAVPVVSATRGMTEKEMQREKEKAMAMKGLVLDDQGIIQAMERGAAGRFLPTGIKENGKYTRADSVLSGDGFQELFSYVRSLVSTMANALIRGEIGADPLMVNGNSCAWCPYGSICLAQKDDRMIQKVKMSRDEVFRAMEQNTEHNEPDGR